MRKSTKRLAMILAILLAAMMVLTFVFGAIAQSASALDTYKNKQKELTAEKARLAEKRKETQKEKKSIISQKYDIDDQIANVEAEIENTTLLIQEYTIQIALTQERLFAKNEEIKAKEDAFLLRMRAMEEAGDVSYISILMQSTNFSELLGRISMISEIAEYDRHIISELQAAKEEIAKEKEQLEIEKIEQQESRQLLSNAQAELAQLYDELNAKIAELEADEKELAKAEEEAEKKMAETQNEINRLMEEARKKNNGPYVGGSMEWPVPEWTRISSPFGTRLHPILKVNKFHSGVDIAAPNGTPVLAANDGTVIMAEYNGGYGNCIVINHGGGIATLYGHNSKLLVKKGDTVKRGQQIAKVGSTGTSTGPHVHFEVKEDGKQVNPLQKKWLGTR